MIKIEIGDVIRQKYKGYLPKWLVKMIEKLIHQDQINEFLQMQTEVDGVAYAHKVLDRLKITATIHGLEKLSKQGKRYLFVCNHPLGGPDGIVLTALLGDYFEGRVRVLVNDLLKNIPQFDDIFLAVNKYGAQGRDRFAAIDAAMESDNHIITFPSGLCSRTNEKGEIRDLPWSPSFLKMARKHGREIVPLYFDAVNSPRFYRWERVRKRLGFRFNYELILLPDELFKAQGSHFHIYTHAPIPLSELPIPQHDKQRAEEIRLSLYSQSFHP